MRFVHVCGILCGLSIFALGLVSAQKKAQPAMRSNQRIRSTVEYSWSPARMKFSSAGRAKALMLEDGSILVGGDNPNVDTYTIIAETDADNVSALRLEALTHESLGGNGPGRASNGNFVISEITAAAGPRRGEEQVSVKIAGAEADFAQVGFPAANAIDGSPRTGWAVSGTDRWNVNRALTLILARPVRYPGGSSWTIKLDQLHGGSHNLGRFRILFGTGLAAPAMIGSIEKPIPIAKNPVDSRIQKPIGFKPLPVGVKPIVTPIAALGTGNWDFETGIQGWAPGTVSGDNRAFTSQPTYGDNVTGRRLAEANIKAMGFDPAIRTLIGGDYWDTPVYTGYQGNWWIGSSEKRPSSNAAQGSRSSEDLRGSLTSPDFVVQTGYLSFLVSGGRDIQNLQVELQIKTSGIPDMDTLDNTIQTWLKLPGSSVYTGVATASGPPTRDGQYITAARAFGTGTDAMTRVVWPVPGFMQGRIARYKITDNSLTSHLNADDFRASVSNPGADLPVWGFVDTHTHPMVHMAFGGGWSGSPGQRNSLIWGSPGGNLEASLVAVDDLPDCDGFTHGNMMGLGNVVLDHILRLIGNFTGSLLRHGTGGFLSGLTTWPAPNGVAGLLHQQMHVQWLRRAFDGGQRILVAAAINNQLLQRAIKNGYDATGNKHTIPDADGDFQTCVQQTLAMKELAAKNSSWMEVVTSPAQARAAIRNNKLAIVLAVETDWLNGMDQVRTLYNLGVRHITPVHLMDNLFGSSAVYDFKFNTLNAWYNGQIFDVVDGTSVGVSYLPERVIPMINFLFNIPTVPGFASGGDLFARGYTVSASWPPSALKHQGYINKYGLANYTRPLGGAAKPAPIAAYKEMMRMGMLIDIAHMSHKSVEEMLALADQQSAGAERGYPVSSSHGGIREHEDHKNERSLTEAQCKRILAIGGTLALGMGSANVNTASGTTVPNDCPGTVKSFAQLIQHSNKLSSPQRGLTLGSDFNGLNGMMGPRFGPKAPSGSTPQQGGVRYMNYVPPAGVTVRTSQPIMRASTMISGKGTRTYDYNLDGLAHYGLIPDMFQDLRNSGLSPEQLGTLFRGAEDFIRMWEKCERLRATIVVAASNPANTAPPPAAASGSARMSGFKPETHGFRFGNTFTNSLFGPPISITSSGLCGGMSYAALDYYLAGIERPSLTYRPAHSTTLQSYIYARQVTSLVQNVDKWVEYNFNPFGSRNNEFFNWGLRERLTELRSFLDRGMPVPLGLEGIGASDHQVLAIGYEMGRYKGDPSGPYKEDLKILLCEPNYPGRTITMVADAAKSEFYYLEDTGKRWRSYFVDGKYVKHAPPQLPTPNYPNDGLVRALQLQFDTGADDMRGGADHVDLKIIFHDNTSQSFTNISENGRWIANYSETVEVALKTPMKPEMFRILQVNTNGTVGPGGDQWDLQRLRVRLVGGGFARDLPLKNPGPFKFFGPIPMFIAVQ